MFRRVEHAQFKAGCQAPAQSQVDFGFADQALLNSFCQMIKGAHAGQVAASFERGRGAFGWITSVGMVLMEVVERPAIRDDMSLESPILAQSLGE